MPAIEYRRATVRDYASSVDLANLVFSAAYRPHDFKKLSPKAYGDEAAFAAVPHYLAAGEDGALRGMVGVLPNTLHIGPHALKTGFVGTVCVHPYARGEGHMKKLMAMALEDMRADGVDLAILSGQRQRYEYFGFSQGGLQRNWRITQTNLRHHLGDAPGPALSLHPADNTTPQDVWAQCAQLNAARPIAATRTAETFYAIAQTCQATVQIIQLEDTFAGYLILEGQTVNEIQLTRWDLLPWVLRLLMQTARLTTLELPTGETELPIARELCRFADRSWLTHYDMIRIFNFPRVLGALLELKATCAPLIDGTFSCFIAQQPLTIEVRQGVPRITQSAPADAVQLTEMEAQALFCHAMGPVATGVSLPPSWAPLPLFMSPADSF